MNSKEILFSAIQFKPLPRVPVMLLSSGLWECARHGISFGELLARPPAEIAHFILENHLLLGSDVLWAAAGFNNLLLDAIGADIAFDTVGEPSSVRAPLFEHAGQVIQIRARMLECSRKIDRLLQVTRILSDEAGGVYPVGVSQWGPFTLAGLLFGTERFLRMCVREKNAVMGVLETAADLIDIYFSLFEQAGARLFCQSDPTASCDMISPKMFGDLALPYLKRIFIRRKGNARICMLHICGCTEKIAGQVTETGTDIFSVDHKVNLPAAKEALRGKAVIAGNLNPVGVLLDGSEETVRSSAAACCTACSGELILMPGCDLPAGSPVRNIRAMVQAAHAFRTQNASEAMPLQNTAGVPSL